MKKSILAILAILACHMAHADIAVATGHGRMATDGLPDVGPGERVSVFWCVAKNGTSAGPDLMECAVKLCQRVFKDPGLCKGDGYAMRPGHAIIVAGPAGDNQFIFAKAIGDKTRQESDKYVRSNKFPVDRSLVLADFFDDGTIDRTGQFVGSGPRKTSGPVVSPGVSKELLRRLGQ